MYGHKMKPGSNQTARGEIVSGPSPAFRSVSLELAAMFILMIAKTDCSPILDRFGNCGGAVQFMLSVVLGRLGALRKRGHQTPCYVRLRIFSSFLQENHQRAYQ